MLIDHWVMQFLLDMHSYVRILLSVLKYLLFFICHHFTLQHFLWDCGFWSWWYYYLQIGSFHFFHRWLIIVHKVNHKMWGFELLLIMKLLYSGHYRVCTQSLGKIEYARAYCWNSNGLNMKIAHFMQDALYGLFLSPLGFGEHGWGWISFDLWADCMN